MTTIGLVAHDDKKDDLVAWVKKHKAVLAQHTLWATGTTGGRIIKGTRLKVTRLLSGPLGGDAQLGAMIAEGRLDVLIFFQDPLTALPHDVDVKALTRLATLYNIPFAVNQVTADLVLAAL
ncbi:MAG: methylglyoxal synthase [Devosia sp.]